MQTKLILNLRNLRGGDREFTTLMTLATFLGAGGFTWEDGTHSPRNLDADAIVVNHPNFESPNVIATYRNGSFNEDTQAKVKAEADTTVFDASKIHEFDLFLTGVKYLKGITAHKTESTGGTEAAWTNNLTAHEASMVDDHLARPMGWSNRGTSDPVYTFEMEGVRVSVCKHVALMTIPKEKGQPSADTTRRLEAEALKVRKEKFGF
jgi:hypothetical protein